MGGVKKDCDPRCELPGLPSGKLTKNYGKSPFLIGKPSINGQFSMAMLNKQRALW